MDLKSIIPRWLLPGPGGTGPEEEAPTGRSPRVADAVTGAEPSVDGHDPGGRVLTQEAELRARREEIVRLEERALRDLESARTQLREAERRAAAVDRREAELDRAGAEIASARERQLGELERISGLTRPEARQALLEEVEHEAQRQAGLTIRRVEEEARLESERRARGILAVAMQRLASAQSVESNTTTIDLPSEDMKGRIIGREGRNIRALEALTGVDIIIDDTPETVVLSSFDGVRREVARIALEKLIADGRIHPASCEAAYEQAVTELDDTMIEAAESALLDARVTGVHPELVRLLGRLRFRTSYSQNVLAHLVECAHLAAMMAAEIGASVEVARRAALLHDIGKAVSHEVEGTHAAVGARLARRYEEIDAITHAIEAHHNEIEPVTVEAVIVQAADAISGARPGARGDSLEQYVTRLSELEEIAMRHEGVHKVFAIQAGREVRVMVDPGRVDDRAVALISHEIAGAIEREMEYPGQIKITVIRELRSTGIAR
ncbi:MAG: ribonuclease Y [Solirubrobacterales bacterium]|nr:ribonuclease Y [Solirubrobacterales bacterium]